MTLPQDFLDHQHGVMTSVQLQANGVTARRIRHCVESGQWLRVFRNVIAVTNGPLSSEMKLRAAVLYGGRGAMLSHDSAAAEWGMARSHEGPVHVTIPRGCSAITQPATMRHSAVRPTSTTHDEIHPGVVVHRSLAIRHIGVAFDPPRTSKADTAMDLAVAEESTRAATAVLVDAMAAGGVAVDAMRRKIELRRPRRYRQALLDTLTMLADGVQSVLEYRYAMDVERAHGLPTGTRQAPVRVGGRVLFEDVEYGRDGVIIRLDGQQFHAAKQTRFRDRRRDNAAELAGRSRLVYGWQEVAHDPCGVYREVREVLKREGWDDSSFPCGRCPVA
jgi:hypothetical protein